MNLNIAQKKETYANAKGLLEGKKNDEAHNVFDRLGDYNDCIKMKNENRYRQASEKVSKKDFENAIKIFNELGEDKDSAAEIIKIKIFTTEVGDIIIFGHYNVNSDRLVLSKDDGQLLLISKDAIMKMSYNDEDKGVTWETCTLRKWLNSEYFSGYDKKIIMDTNVVNGINSKHGTVGGNDTTDKVFLLSIDEANKYFNSNPERICKLDGDLVWWWLRSPGRVSAGAMGVSGGVHELGSYVSNDAPFVLLCG